MGGNWGRPRPGLTLHEHGIPPAYLRDRLAAHGFVIERETFTSFPAIRKL